MKRFFMLLAMAAVPLLAGMNLVPNGEFKDPRGYKAHLRILSPGAKAAYKGSLIVTEASSAKGRVEINCHRLTGFKPGARYYVRMPFEVTSFDPQFANTASLRAIFWDAQGKAISKSTSFSPKVRITGVGSYDLYHHFRIPAGAESCSLSFWLDGIKAANVSALYFSSRYPVNAPDGNLLLNGGLESSCMADFYFRGTSVPPERIIERSTARAKKGRYSLRSFCSNPKKGTEINFNNFLFTPGKQYCFSVDYFISSASGNNRISSRFTFWDAKGKVIRYMFPEWKNASGEWNKAKITFFPPVNCARVTVTLWISGKQEVFFDNFYYGVLEEKQLANRDAAARLISSDDTATVWKEAPYLKVPYEKIPAGVKKESTITLNAAANESEPFQVVVNAKKDLDSVTLKFSDLKGAGGTIAASNITSRVVGFIFLKAPDNPGDKGFNADPILPETSARAVRGKNLPFYVLVKVPAETAPGSYSGTVDVFSGNKKISSFKLALEVHNFALPDTAHLKTYFYGQPSRDYVSIDKRPRAGIITDFHRLLKEHRMTGNQAIGSPHPPYTIKDGKLTVTDWSAFDKDIELRNKVYGQISFPVPYLGMLGDNGGWFRKKGEDRSKPRNSPFGKFSWISPDGLKYAGQFAAQFTAHVKKKFPKLNFYAYLYDEPAAKVHADLKILLDSIHAAAPDLKIFIPKEQTGNIGYTHTFCVPLTPGHYKPALQDEHMRKGGDIWYYNWSVRISNHNYHLNRFFAWRIYAGKGNGGLLWNTVYFPRGVNPWTDLDKTHHCGAATIFYPPRKKGELCVPTLRSALIKESIDDFDYMRILQLLIDSRYPGLGRRRVLEMLKETMPTFPFGECNDPHLIYTVREKMAREINGFKEFPGVVVSTPSDHSSVETAPGEFFICAPAGTQIRIDGKAVSAKASPKGVKVPFLLSKLGKNRLSVELVYKGKTYRYIRTFELKADPRLKDLQALAAKCTGAGIDMKAVEAFLKKVNSGAPYTEKERTLTGKYLETFKRAMAESAFKKKRTFVNDLEKFFFGRAGKVFGYKQFERSEYYLALAAEAANAGSMKSFKVKVTPTVCKGHPGLIMENGIVRAVILETGGWLVSFKVKGVETLVSGLFNKVMAPEKRSAQHATRAMIYNLSGYDGYGDAGGGGIWPITYVDWNIAVKELKSDRASIEFSMKLPNTPFLFKRTMTMAVGSPDLKIAYEIINQMPADAASDDPEHFQLPWRGRMMPAIGSGKLPQQDDTLVVPVKFADEKLAEDHFTAARPVNYERRSIRLAKPFMGAFDVKLKKGVVMIGDSTITHGYVWFASKGNHLGSGKVYTLEFPRSFYGKKHNDREANTPLTIHPGKSLNFAMTIRGLENVSSAADLTRQAGF